MARTRGRSRDARSTRRSRRSIGRASRGCARSGPTTRARSRARSPRSNRTRSSSTACSSGRPRAPRSSPSTRATGRELWRFDPIAQGSASQGHNRGVVLLGLADGRPHPRGACGQDLWALDAKTGLPIESFGKAGRTDLRAGLAHGTTGGDVTSPTPGAIYRDLLILGTKVGETDGAAPGDIRAYDLITGAMRWIFHTIPRARRIRRRHLAEGCLADARRRELLVRAHASTASAASSSLPTGSATFDFWGGNRTGDNLFANCLLALDAATGERVWHFQFVHHDLWDRDLPAPPDLVDREAGRAERSTPSPRRRSPACLRVRARDGRAALPDRGAAGAGLATSKGEVRLEDAALPAPAAALHAPALRPRPTSPNLARIARAVLERLREVRSGQALHAAEPRGLDHVSGLRRRRGVGRRGRWIRTALLYVNANEMPWILTMVPHGREGDGAARCGRALHPALRRLPWRQSRRATPAQSRRSWTSDAAEAPPDIVALLDTGKGVMPSFAFLSGRGGGRSSPSFVLGERAAGRTDAARRRGAGRLPTRITGYNRFLDPDGYPAVKPPWGTLNAIDLNTGEIRWRCPLGEIPELTKREASRRPAPRITAARSSPRADWSSSLRPRTR